MKLQMHRSICSVVLSFVFLFGCTEKSVEVDSSSLRENRAVPLELPSDPIPTTGSGELIGDSAEDSVMDGGMSVEEAVEIYSLSLQTESMRSLWLAMTKTR